MTALSLRFCLRKTQHEVYTKQQRLISLAVFEYQINQVVFWIQQILSHRACHPSLYQTFGGLSHLVIQYPHRGSTLTNLTHSPNLLVPSSINPWFCFVFHVKILDIRGCSIPCFSFFLTFICSDELLDILAVTSPTRSLLQSALRLQSIQFVPKLDLMEKTSTKNLPRLQNSTTRVHNSPNSRVTSPKLPDSQFTVAQTPIFIIDQAPSVTKPKLPESQWSKLPESH